MAHFSTIADTRLDRTESQRLAWSLDYALGSGADRFIQVPLFDQSVARTGTDT
ncbi:hypothetical protein QFZ33_000745 [Arthrobacter globiformis]|nr:hypothetical protein [Arthrobacter globiformis]